MRFDLRYKGPHTGDKRIVKRFLLFPKRIKDERRWLETATWEQEYCFYYATYRYGDSYCWVDIRWVD